MLVIGGSASKNIAEDLSKELKTGLVQTIVERFPDGELYVRILGDVLDEDLIIVQTTHPDDKIIELFLLQDAARDAGAKKITVIIPYFGYARQDTKFKDGEPVSAKTLAKLISLNADKVFTIDPHKEHILDFFTVPAYSVSAVSEIAFFLKNKKIDMLLAPDKGALKRVQKASEIIGCDFDYMEKTRIDGNTVEMKPKNLNVQNKTVAIIDDIISTGSTMAKSIDHLKQHGAKNVFVACTHGLFADGAIKKLKNAGVDEIISTDTIKNEFDVVKTSSIIKSFLEKNLD